MAITYTLLGLSVIVLNIPFGYWRQGVKKFSLYWFAYIHLPVPFVILLRQAFGVSLSLKTAPFLFSFYFMGQAIGKHIRMRRVSRASVNNTIINEQSQNRSPKS